MTRSLLSCLGLTLALAACAELQGDATDRQADAGSCGADERQDWVGKRVDVLNDVDLPEGTRVLFPTTPATMDFRDDRLNVAVDKSDVISRVYCG